MKLYFLSIITLYMVFAWPVNSIATGNHGGNGLPGQILFIDLYDTVIFDISQANIISNTVEFPVSISSDETVNAVDFSLRFNHNAFEFDTIINVTSYLQDFSNYNAGDSTIYFTSYSIQPISNDTPLILIRFNMLGGQLCGADLENILSYLNGEPCTAHVIDCLPDEVSDQENNLTATFFPNPVTEKALLNFQSPVSGNYILNLADMTGRIVFNSNYHAASGENKIEIDFSGFEKGIYTLSVFSDERAKNIKVEVQ